MRAQWSPLTCSLHYCMCRPNSRFVSSRVDAGPFQIPFVALPKLNHAHSRNLWIGFIPSIVHPFPNQEAMMQTGEKRIRVISVIVWHHILHDYIHTHASQLDGLVLGFLALCTWEKDRTNNFSIYHTFGWGIHSRWALLHAFHLLVLKDHT